MKKLRFIYLGVLLTVLCSFCAKNIYDQSEIPASKTLAEASPQNGIIPDSVYYFDLVIRPAKHGWKDYDQYYRLVIPRYHSNQPYTENLKKATLAAIANTGKLNEITDKAVIEWYTNELVALPLPDTDALIKYLDALHGYWPNSKIKQTAETSYINSIAYIKQHIKNPDHFLAKSQSRYDRFQDYISRVAMH